MKSVVTNPVDQVRRDKSSSSVLMVHMGEMWFQAGLMDYVAAVQEHRRLEESVRDQMEDGKGESAPNPHSMIMYPIWPIVENPSVFLMSFWASIMVAPRMAVSVPMRRRHAGWSSSGRTTAQGD